MKTRAPLRDDPEGCPRGDAQRVRWIIMQEDTLGRARLLGQRQPSHAPHILYDNDPSAGSPTETLLRLLLPLNDQV